MMIRGFMDTIGLAVKNSLLTSTCLLLSLHLLFLLHSPFFRGGVLPVVAQIADPVDPHYDHSSIAKFYTYPFPIPDNASVTELKNRLAIGYGEIACLNKASSPHQVHNQIFFYGIYSELPHNFDPKSSIYLEGTTYWFNEDLHVGHVHYDIVLVQLMQSTKIDRIIMQRSVCRANICNGIGAVESFYKGYFAALFDAFEINNGKQIPVYVRYGKETHVKPIYFNIKHPSLIDPNPAEYVAEKYKEVELKDLMCFEKVLRRGKPHTYGGLPTVSASAVQAFKKSAYRLIPPMNTFFVEGEPFIILFSYRGMSATRHISNLEDFFTVLRKNFAAPNYVLKLLNSSDPSLDYKTQMRAVAEAHVVISNHGAFEGNMIYMKNSSLLLEIFGHYGNNEIHTFHRLAMMWGLFYARVQPKDLTDHLADSYKIADSEMNYIVEMVKDYFAKERYKFNMKKVGEFPPYINSLPWTPSTKADSPSLQVASSSSSSSSQASSSSTTTTTSLVSATSSSSSYSSKGKTKVEKKEELMKYLLELESMLKALTSEVASTEKLMEQTKVVLHKLDKNEMRTKLEKSLTSLRAEISSTEKLMQQTKSVLSRLDDGKLS